MNYSPYAVKAVFEALQASYGKIKSPEAPAIAQYEYQTLKKIPADGNPMPPKLMFTLFNGSKALGSKVKFSKFYLIFDYTMEALAEGVDALAIYYKVTAAIKKTLQSHKLGENGFKPNASGSYYNAHENHNETFKLIEDAISNSGANANGQILTIGINVDPDQFFNPDQGKYDIDGPKNLYDSKMLADWYVKIVNDHPLLSYIEDPVRVGDVDGWKTVMQTMQAKHEQVRIGVSKWFESDLNTIKQWTQMISKNDDDEPEEVDEEEEPPEDPNA